MGRPEQRKRRTPAHRRWPLAARFFPLLLRTSSPGPRASRPDCRPFAGPHTGDGLVL
ncbi:hypothetical protein BDW02DRAFT_565942 [Decorospora gaudefroyi]|uniref:Uncharacterized protein n=1 Tax=Decorospora gaudefroyi TaxID=184978 RepID=A0A6A5KK05_9PLEO|nr:hypothetical protein BDW02DRAFT_565942 [Decorospora gaudefroyi]